MIWLVCKTVHAALVILSLEIKDVKIVFLLKIDYRLLKIDFFYIIVS